MASHPHQPRIAREAEREHSPRLRGSRADQRRHVGIATDDAVEDHDVRGRRELRVGCDVPVAPVDPVREAGLLEQCPSVLLIRGRELHVRRTLGAGPQQLEVDRADAAADLQHGLSLPDADGIDETLSDLVQAALAVAACELAREALVEHV